MPQFYYLERLDGRPGKRMVDPRFTRSLIVYGGINGRRPSRFENEEVEAPVASRDVTGGAGTQLPHTEKLLTSLGVTSEQIDVQADNLL